MFRAALDGIRRSAEVQGYGPRHRAFSWNPMPTRDFDDAALAGALRLLH